MSRDSPTPIPPPNATAPPPLPLARPRVLWRSSSPWYGEKAPVLMCMYILCHLDMEETHLCWHVRPCHTYLCVCVCVCAQYVLILRATLTIRTNSQSQHTNTRDALGVTHCIRHHHLSTIHQYARHSRHDTQYRRYALISRTIPTENRRDTPSHYKQHPQYAQFSLTIRTPLCSHNSHTTLTLYVYRRIYVLYVYMYNERVVRELWEKSGAQIVRETIRAPLSHYTYMSSHTVSRYLNRCRTAYYTRYSFILLHPPHAALSYTHTTQHLLKIASRYTWYALILRPAPTIRNTQLRPYYATLTQNSLMIHMIRTHITTCTHNTQHSLRTPIRSTTRNTCDTHSYYYRYSKHITTPTTRSTQLHPQYATHTRNTPTRSKTRYTRETLSCYLQPLQYAQHSLTTHQNAQHSRRNEPCTRHSLIKHASDIHITIYTSRTIHAILTHRCVYTHYEPYTRHSLIKHASDIHIISEALSDYIRLNP